ncbi:hypothetical protein AGMMS49944_09450 [Spirochaetia bacterium]|nr:hypothetical protein AGMMS49944_09450 [Spirochaetia bacterium]
MDTYAVLKEIYTARGLPFDDDFIRDRAGQIEGRRYPDRGESDVRIRAVLADLRQGKITKDQAIRDCYDRVDRERAEEPPHIKYGSTYPYPDWTTLTFYEHTALINTPPDTAVETSDPIYPPAAYAVINEYPQFAKDLPLLKGRCITDNETKDGYIWIKSKQSLAEYFGFMGHKPTPWKIIENLFNEIDLKNSFSSNGNAYGKNKPSTDYIEIKKILENTPES